MTIEGNSSEVRLWTMLRAIAALAVVVFHFKRHVLYPLGDLPVVGEVFRHGDYGVDLFFVLSGFVMQYVYGEAIARNRFQYREFLLRRFARIYPVHFVTLLGALAMLTVAGLAHVAPVDFRLIVLVLPLQLLLLHGLGFGGAETLNYPSWSVSSEMFAYVCFPLVAQAIRRSSAAIWLLLIVLGVLLYVAWDVTNLVNYGAIRVILEFTLGVALCSAVHGRKGRTAGLALLTAASMLFCVAVNLDWPRSSAVMSLAGVVTGAFLCDGFGKRTRLGEGLLYLGRISYSIYMVHALVEAPGFKIAQWLTHSPEEQSPLWVLPVLVLVTIGLAAVLFHLVEKPFRQRLVVWGNRLLAPTSAAAQTRSLRP